MVPFVIGYIAGSCVTLGILFIAAVSEDQPKPPRRPEELPYYMEDDGR